MKKRLLSFILILALALGMLSGCSESETIETAETVNETFNQIETDITEESTVTVTEHTEEKTTVDITEYTEAATEAVTRVIGDSEDSADECDHDYVMKKDFPATCQSDRTAIFACSKCHKKKTVVYEDTQLEHEYVEEILEKASSDGSGKREVFA